MMTLRGKGNKDLMSQVLAKLTPANSKNPVEVVRSTQDDLLSTIKYTLTTGIEPIDSYTGGFPFGRIVEVYGVEGSAKTALALRCCARAQQHFIYERIVDHGTKQRSFKKIDDDCEIVILYIDNEQSLDEGDKLIVDGLEVDALISRCDTVDELFDIMERVLTTVNTVSEGSEKPVFVVVVVDTIAGTSTKAEMEAEWGTVDYPRAPRALREGFRKMTRKINRHNVLMICTNQVGENFKGPKKRNLNPFAQDLPRPEDFQSSGGRAIKFFASLRIFMFPVNQEFKLSRGNQGPSGFVGGFITVKNRQVKPRREGRFVLLYDGGLNNIFSILETMMKCKTVTRGERGIIEFRFRAHGIETTTFPDQRPNTNPKIEGNAAWPAFYEAHRPDLDLLWQKTVDLTFNEVTTSEDSEDNE